MRILHTSDWHLGRSFGDFRLLDDQIAFLSWLADLVVGEGIELVAVAGDLYDRSVPPSDAVAAFRNAVRSIRQAGAEIVAIAGNHDSPERVAAFDGLTDASGLLLRGGYERSSQVEVRQYSDGPLAIAAVPFLDPIMAPEGYVELVDEADGRLRRLGHGDVLDACLSRVRTQTEGMRTLVLAHAFVVGGTASTSERDVSVGGTDLVPTATFDGFSYVALGHLHSPQTVGGSAAIRYSGSPLTYSFSQSEMDRPKQVVIVDMDASGEIEVTPVDVPVGRAARLIRGRFAEVMEGPELAGDPFVRVELTDPTRVLDAHSQLREKFVNLAELAYVGKGSSSADQPTAAAMAKLSPIEQVRAFWTDSRDEELEPEAEDVLRVLLVDLEREGR